MVYNTYKPKQTRCPTCGTGLHKQNARTCPDVASISMYLAEKTGYEGTLKEDDKVCFSCYKFHLHILKCIEKESTDTDLEGLIEGIKHTILKPKQVVSVDDAVSRAMSITTVHVGETLLRQEVLLLPAVHNFFIQKINECIPKDREQCFTARWVLSNLKTSLQQHLSKIKKCGTLLYRSNGDTLVALTNALYKMSRLTNVTSTHGNEGDGKCEAQNTDSMQMWGQASSNEIILKPVFSYGWKMIEGKLAFDWDSDHNVKKVQNRVQGLLKGCKCTKGCKTNVCGCKQRGQICSEGCQCHGCVNLSHELVHSPEVICSGNDGRREEDQTEGVSDDEEGNSAVENESADEDTLNNEVDEIMQNIFGDDYKNEDSSEELY